MVRFFGIPSLDRSHLDGPMKRSSLRPPARAIQGHPRRRICGCTMNIFSAWAMVDTFTSGFRTREVLPLLRSLLLRQLRLVLHPMLQLVRRPQLVRRLSLSVLVFALILALAPHAGAQLVVPPRWFSGDLHVHWPDNDCYGVAPPEVVYAAMPSDLNIAGVLLWAGGGHFEQNAADYFWGQEDNPISTPNKIVHYDLEVSAFRLADRLGHVGYVYLNDIDFPRVGYHGPIQTWAKAQGAVIGSDHSQAWTSSLNQFPPIEWCCAPYATPVDVALGRVDYLTYQGPQRARWRFLWYTLLDCGFRPGITASSDASCLYTIGSYRTYARIIGPLTYEKFVRAVAQGRTVAVEEGDNFVHFTVNQTVEVGDQVDAISGQPLILQARVILPNNMPRTGVVEIVRNGLVIASQSYSQTGGEVTLTELEIAGRSSWYSARTAKSHAGAVFVEVNGEPIRAAAGSADYFVRYMDYFRQTVEGDFFYQLTAGERAALIAEIDQAKGIYETIRDEALEQPTSVADAMDSALPAGGGRAWPNPFRREMEITVNVDEPVAGSVSVNIFGPDGRGVRSLLVHPQGERLASVLWDGLDAEGRPVPNGVYFYRLERGGRSLGAGRIVRVR